MRILLLPVTKARVAIFCQRQAVPSVRATPRLDDRLASKGEKMWHGFETSDKKWKQVIVRSVNRLLETVNFEERCLRTIPPRNTWKRKVVESKDMVAERQALRKNLKLEPLELVYPSSAKSITKDFNAAHSVIVHQVRNSSATHKKQIAWCILGLPLTLPLAINPFVPNFPAFYLIYRIWCNWRAIESAKHLNYLSQHHQLTGTTLEPLNEIYERFDEEGTINYDMVNRIGDLFNDNQLRRELHQAVKRVEKQRSNT